jgi:putative flippase GtrA
MHSDLPSRGLRSASFQKRWTALVGLRRLLESRFPTIAPAVLFTVVGTSGFLVDLSLFWLTSTLIWPQAARALAIGTAMSWNFLGNRWITFASQRGSNVIQEYVRFCAACSLGAIVNWTVSLATWSFLTEGSASKLAGAAAGSVAGAGINFLLSHRWVFRKESATAPAIDQVATDPTRTAA